MDIPEWHRELNVYTGHISADKDITRCKVHTKLQNEWPQGVMAGLLTTSLQTGHRIDMSKARNEASSKSVGSDISSSKFICRLARPWMIDRLGGWQDTVPNSAELFANSTRSKVQKILPKLYYRNEEDHGQRCPSIRSINASHSPSFIWYVGIALEGKSRARTAAE